MGGHTSMVRHFPIRGKSNRSVINWHQLSQTQMNARFHLNFRIINDYDSTLICINNFLKCRFCRTFFARINSYTFLHQWMWMCCHVNYSSFTLMVSIIDHHLTVNIMCESVRRCVFCGLCGLLKSNQFWRGYPIDYH